MLQLLALLQLCWLIGNSNPKFNNQKNKNQKLTVCWLCQIQPATKACMPLWCMWLLLVAAAHAVAICGWLLQMHFSKEAIDDLKYAPDCSKLAAGSHDNFIDIFDVKRK